MFPACVSASMTPRVRSMPVVVVSMCWMTATLPPSGR